MGWWQVGADTLAGSRFVLSPLAETTAALRVLLDGVASHPGERAWLAAHLPAHRARLAAGPVTALLLEAGYRHHWTADFLTPTPTGEEAGFAAEVDVVRRTPPERARADLAVALGGPLPAALDRDDLPQRAADLLEWVWTHTVEPTWERRRRIAEADVLARSAQLARGGWAAALDGMGPGKRWLGEGRLQINAYDNPPRELAPHAQLLFVPVTPRSGWVSWDMPDRYALVYPCAGVLADAGRTVVPGGLARLLGPARAGVLVLLDTPKTTTQLTALTGQGLGSVGGHLRVLLEAGLVHRRRAGRSVLYRRTAAAEVLLDAGRNGRKDPFGT